MRRKWWGRRAVNRQHDKPIASLHELRRVHRRLRRWGRALPYEEFAGWRLDRDAPRRTWREVRRRQRNMLMYGMAAAVVLTVVVANPSLELSAPKLSLPSLQVAVLQSGLVPVSVSHAPASPDIPEWAGARPAPLPTLAPDLGGLPLQREPEHAPAPGEAPPAHANAGENEMVVTPDPEDTGGDRIPVTVASLDAAVLSEHALAASIIVAGSIESVDEDALIMRVELALKGSVADRVYIAIPTDGETDWGLQPGTRLLAYLSAPDEAETETEEEVSPLLRPAGRGALVGLSPLTSP